MILIVICRDYSQFKRFAQSYFPYRKIGKDIVCLDSRADIYTLLGVERGQMFIDIGADDPALRDFCEARKHIEIELKGGV